MIAGYSGLGRLIGHSLQGSRKSQTDGQRVRLQGIAATPKKDLLEIKELLETGTFVPVIDRTYPLNQTADAIRYLETKHARGKVIITMVHEDNP